MTRHERRVLFDCLGIGVAVTLLVIAADAVGLLTPLENALYDARARRCQFFTPPPTDKLVHLDLDDRALETSGGRWPWPRARWAQIFDELRRAQPKAIEMDLMFAEPQDIQFNELRGGAKFERIDNDRKMADALGGAGNVILPLSIDPKPPHSREYAAMIDAYRREPDLDETLLSKRLAEQGFAIADSRLAAEALPARRAAVFARIAEEIKNGASGPDDLRKRLLPTLDPDLQSPIGRLINEQFDRLQAVAEFARFSYPLPQGASEQIARGAVKIVPLRILSENSDAGAFVDYPQFTGGGAIVRTVPLLLREQDSDRVYTQMGLRLACRMLDIDPADMRITPTELRVGGDKLRVPLCPPQTSTEGVRLGALFDIPWTGGDDWRTMYDFPAHRRIARHLSINFVWEAVDTARKIARNTEEIDESIRHLYAVLDPPKLTRFEASPPADLATRAQLVEQLLKDAQDFVAQYKMMKPEEIDELGQRFLAATTSLPTLLRQTHKLEADLQTQREDLSKALKDKAVLIGWIATGFTDMVPTPLHERCPGVVVHGAVFNALMTGEMWRSAPWWISAILTTLLGLIASFTTARFPPLPALLIALCIACVFAIFNGVVLFDYFNIVLPAAGTLVAIGLVYAACTTTRVIIESAERRRITGRFRNYVDPKLVNYVLEHPEVRLDGEKREMTVVFTDLAGFTSLSEKLGEKIVPLLNELLGELVPVIRDHHTGLVNKFLGDGIMFFYNAPKLDPHHAADAVATVLDMHAKVAEFNQRLKERGLPEIFMRAGICTGEMIVGDAGGAGAADYTVLGDAVNLGARLEPANKQLGTRTLITARTAELVDGQFILRAVGKIRVVGKDEAVMTFEPLARADGASDEIKKVAFLFKNLVEKYAGRQFHDSLAIADDIDSLIGPSKLVHIYRDLAKRHIDHPPADDFDGRIVLTEK